jgi:hypothetical protein
MNYEKIMIGETPEFWFEISGERIFDNLGIRIKMSEIPEWKAYLDYRYPTNPFLYFFRKWFKRKRVEEMRLISQAAICIKVLEESKRRFE